VAEEHRKFRVYVRARTHQLFFEAKAAVPADVRAHVDFIYLGDPSRIRGVRHPMVWRADGWAEHLHAAELDRAEQAAMSTRWSWPPVGSGSPPP
jgi:hypothetical protein